MQPALLFEPEPVQGLPGPAVGPKGPKYAKNPGPDLSFYPPEGLHRKVRNVWPVTRPSVPEGGLHVSLGLRTLK